MFLEYVRQVVAATTFDLPDALIEREADSILREREAEYERYGIRPEQIYEATGKKREEWIEELKPAAEERAKRGLVLREIAKAEGWRRTRQRSRRRSKTLWRVWRRSSATALA